MFPKAVVLVAAILQLFFLPVTSNNFLPSGLTVWFWQASIVVGNWLYIDGGETWNASNTATWNTQTFAIDISQSWTTSTVNVVSHNKTGDKNLSVRRPTLWYSAQNNIVYCYGGEPYYRNDGVSVWGFTPDGHGGAEWTEQFQKGDSSSFTNFTRPAGSLSAASPTTAYNLGGYTNSATDPDLPFIYGYTPAVTGMVTFDYSSETWKNQSTDGAFAILGEGQYIPIFGKQGVLIFVGGDAPTSQTYSLGASLVPMSTVTVYDIASQRFYKQTAGGQVPQSRAMFCSVAVGAADNTSYEIYIFGGQTGSTPSSSLYTDLSTVYILTLPAFTWLPVTNATSRFRAAHHCSVIGRRQMLSIGGFTGTFPPQPDNLPNGLGVFDLTDLKWGPSYDSNAAAYERSNLVQDYYNGNPRYPNTWADPALASIFTVAATPPKSGAGASPQKSHNAGAIAGGVVGGLGALALFAALAFWLLRRRKRTAGGLGGRESRYTMPGFSRSGSKKVQPAYEPAVQSPVEADGREAQPARYELLGSTRQDQHQQQQEQEQQRYSPGLS